MGPRRRSGRERAICRPSGGCEGLQSVPPLDSITEVLVPGCEPGPARPLSAETDLPHTADVRAIRNSFSSFIYIQDGASDGFKCDMVCDKCVFCVCVCGHVGRNTILDCVGAFLAVYRRCNIVGFASHHASIPKLRRCAMGQGGEGRLGLAEESLHVTAPGSMPVGRAVHNTAASD